MSLVTLLRHYINYPYTIFSYLQNIFGFIYLFASTFSPVMLIESLKLKEVNGRVRNRKM